MDRNMMNKIAYLYLVNAVSRKRISLNRKMIRQISQALDTTPQTTLKFFDTLEKSISTEGEFVPPEDLLQLALPLLKLYLKENGFMFTPLTIKEKVKQTAEELPISYKKACIFVRDLLKDMIDEIFSEFE